MLYICYVIIKFKNTIINALLYKWYALHIKYRIIFSKENKIVFYLIDIIYEVAIIFIKNQNGKKNKNE